MLLLEYSYDLGFCVEHMGFLRSKNLEQYIKYATV